MFLIIIIDERYQSHKKSRFLKISDSSSRKNIKSKDSSKTIIHEEYYQTRKLSLIVLVIISMAESLNRTIDKNNQLIVDNFSNLTTSVKVWYSCFIDRIF